MAATNKERSPAIRLTAQERRDAIIDAVMHDFAVGGFDATPAAVFAMRAGASQPDLAGQAMPSVAAALDLPEAWS